MPAQSASWAIPPSGNGSSSGGTTRKAEEDKGNGSKLAKLGDEIELTGRFKGVVFDTKLVVTLLTLIEQMEAETYQGENLWRRKQHDLSPEIKN